VMAILRWTAITRLSRSPRHAGTVCGDARVAGSWVEIRGEDRRIEMDGTASQSVARLASDARNTILNDYHFTPEVRQRDALFR